MSKAFTKEDEGAPSPPTAARRGVPIPAGVPNCVTPAGHAALLAEQRRLAREPRTPEIDARLRDLADHLATAQITPPPAGDKGVGGKGVGDKGLGNKVGFGAIVT